MLQLTSVYGSRILYAVFIAALSPFLIALQGEEVPHLSYDLRLIMDEDAQYIPFSRVVRHLTSEHLDQWLHSLTQLYRVGNLCLESANLFFGPMCQCEYRRSLDTS